MKIQNNKLEILEKSNIILCLRVCILQIFLVYGLIKNI